MAKTLAIFGATGQQGHSIIQHIVHSDPTLSQTYKIRALTRSPTSPAAQHLHTTYSTSISIVQCDALDPSSLATALHGVHTVFIMTAPLLSPDTEYETATRIADAAVASGAAYLVFSTLPSVRELSGGKYTKVSAFDVKARAERYIRGLPIQSAFVSLGSFMENFEMGGSFLVPRWEGEEGEGDDGGDGGKWVVALPVSEDVQWPLIHAVRDTGKFVGAILAEPERFQGRTVCGATRLYSLGEMISIMSKATGKEIQYKRISVEEFKRRMNVPDALSDMFVEMLGFLEETGYFGPESGELVAWAAENARGKLGTFEEYLEAHPLRLG